MPHHKLQFPMPANSAVVFDAFHFHAWRCQWDSLVSNTAVVGGAPCPYKGAITENTGGRWMRTLSMRTQFVSFDRPALAAASMVGTSFPFVRWAASMRHVDVSEDSSVLIYTYSFQVGPRWIKWLLTPIVDALFLRQTKRRFHCLQQFLPDHKIRIAAWQRDQQMGPQASHTGSAA